MEERKDIWSPTKLLKTERKSMSRVRKTLNDCFRDSVIFLAFLSKVVGLRQKNTVMPREVTVKRTKLTLNLVFESISCFPLRLKYMKIFPASFAVVTKAVNIPEFLVMLASVELSVRKPPCAHQIMAAPTPRRQDVLYRKMSLG